MAARLVRRGVRGSTGVRRREKIRAKGGKLAYREKQIRTEPADLANTILQMSRKRGYVNAMRVAVAASDVFDNDLEALTEVGIEIEDARQVEQPQATAAPAPAPREKDITPRETKPQERARAGSPPRRGKGSSRSGTPARRSPRSRKDDSS